MPRIPFPIRGINEDFAKADQLPLTTADALNVRGVDPKTGRTRGGSRGGLTRLCDQVNGSNAIQALNVVTYNNNRTTYTVNETPTVDWANSLDANTLYQHTYRLAVDTAGNVYAVQGDTQLVKYNPTGEQVWRIEVPVPTAGQSVRAMDIDSLGNIYVATSSGPNGLTGSVWAYRPSEEDDEPEIRWELELDGYCPDLKASGGRLYLLENQTNAAYLRVYSSIRTSNPNLLWSKAVPAPAGQLAVSNAGEVYVASPPNASRGVNTDSGVCSDASVNWIPTDIGDSPEYKAGADPQPGIAAADRLWSWHAADKIVGLSDGDRVDFWTDQTGNERDFYSATVVNPAIASPTYAATGICAKPGIKFSQDDKTGLLTEFANGQDDDLNKSLFPGTVGSRFTMFMVAKIPNAGENTQTLFSHFGNESVWHRVAIVANAAENLAATDDDTVKFDVRPVADGAGTGGAVDQFEFENDSNVSIIAYIFDGDSDTQGTDTSHLRVNGTVIDTFSVSSDRTAWRSTLGFHGTNTSLGYFDGVISEVLVVNGGIQYDATPENPCEVKTVEGYLAHKYGMQHLLPSGHIYKTLPPSGSGDTEDEASQLALRSTDGVLAKFGAQRGNLRWAVSGAGHGYGVALGTGNRVFSTGPTTEESNVTVRCYIDEGDEYSTDGGDGAWTREDENPTYAYPQLAVDSGGQLYIPVHEELPGTTLRKIDTTGTANLEYAYAGEERAYAVAIPPTLPDYGTQDIDEPEHLLLGLNSTDNTDIAQTTGVSIARLELVAAEVSGGNPRERATIAIAGGNIAKISDAGAIASVTGGVGAVDATSPWVATTTLLNKLYIVDGEGYQVYDPQTDTASAWKSTTAGEIPERCKLITSWNGRIVLARGANPHNWFMSEVGNPNGWDFFPPVPLATQAVEGVNSRAGAVPDTVNALIPYSDDLLIFGGDKSIYRLTGDPMAGGALDLVTDDTGIAFGSPWCKDPEGRLYFFGSRGGVYVMAGGPPQMISGAIERRLKDLDLGTFTARLVWSTRENGLHVYMVPLGSLTTQATQHYFWDAENNAWWVDSFKTTEMNPTRVVLSDGDEPGDRRILIGCGDGRIRKVNPDAMSDDGDAIASRVLIGPVTLGETEARFRNLRVTLARDQGGCHYSFYGGDTSELPTGPARQRGFLEAGRNPSIRGGVRGDACWLELSLNDTDRRWATETIDLDIFPAGRSRTR